MPQIIPVLDVLAGRVVLANGGDRRRFPPLESALTISDAPADVTHAFIDRHRATDIYMADLDALLGQSRQWDTINVVRQIAPRLWVDAAVTSPHDARLLANMDVDVVVGLETLPNLMAWETIVRAVDPNRLVFSLDLNNGQPIGWPGQPLDVATSILEAALAVRPDGISRMIVLDLGQVGRGAGLRTESICETLIRRFPDVDVFAGGGIRNHDDVKRLGNLGVAGVLVATALHNGEL